ncbi:hypothetical protein OKA05_26995 [Luteolibacter arcticus]|uniref:Uncharacterized protein n=1 Tax=Luteolibacter arcticus TaxID=1581411 RepID=A0ABT3GRT3_9BACT|nr:hypothetical protein [Luteolibacter arcticus]MCW1926234.1 hypothetical protein [Luteolibacter arcticus]
MTLSRSARFLLVLLFGLLAILQPSAISAEEGQHDVVISWRHERLFEDAEPSSRVAIPAVLYYWNDEKVGKDRDGLAAIYDRLVTFKGNSVLIKHRPREWSKSLSDPFDSDTLQHFNNLFRKRNLRLSIEYVDDKRDNVAVSEDNPFWTPQAFAAPSEIPSSPVGGDESAVITWRWNVKAEGGMPLTPAGPRYFLDGKEIGASEEGVTRLIARLHAYRGKTIRVVSAPAKINEQGPTFTNLPPIFGEEWPRFVQAATASEVTLIVSHKHPASAKSGEQEQGKGDASGDAEPPR